MSASRRRLVVDTNFLISAVIGKRKFALSLIETFARRVDFFAPAVGFAELHEHLPGLLAKWHVPAAEGLAVLERLAVAVQPLDAEITARFEIAARLRIDARDPKDWPVLAAALALTCPLWTDDNDFFGTGIATWSTPNVRHYLDAEA